jgi:MFS transporter, DHA1 family, multidrug resistance protein
MSPIKKILLISYIGLASLSAAFITPALPNIAQFYHLTPAAAGWVVSIFLVGYVIGQLIYGPLAERFGILQALRTGLVINLAGVLICLCSIHPGAYTLLLIGRAVSALGSAAGLSCTFMMMHALLSKKENASLSHFIMLSFTMSIGLAVLIGGYITAYFTWSDGFYVLLAHGLFMLLVTFLFSIKKDNTSVTPIKQLATNIINAFKSPTLIRYALILGFVSSVSYGYATAAPLYAHRVLHLSAASYGNWNLLNMLGMLGSGYLSQYFVKQYAAKHALHRLWILVAISLIILIINILSHAANPLYFFMCTTFVYFTSGALFSPASTLALQNAKEHTSASSAMSFINMSTAFITTCIIGYVL